MREMCGALCGASMVCGVLKGNTKAAPEEKERIFAQVRNLAGAFRQEFGTIYCRELLHLDPNLQEGARPSVRTDDYYASRPCERCIAFCAALVEKFLEAQEGK